MTRPRFPAFVLVLTTATVLGACAGSDRTVAPEAGTPLALLGGSSPQLLSCANAPASTSGIVTPSLGGRIAVGGVSITLPAGAVVEPTTISITVPASPHREVQIRANGQEHFQFLETAVVTLSYESCGVSLLAPALAVWNVDEATRAPLAQMLSVDNRLTRTVTFVTNHLSGYAIANRTGEGGGEGEGEGGGQ